MIVNMGFYNPQYDFFLDETLNVVIKKYHIVNTY